MTGKMETPFYHDESVPNFGQIPDYDQYQGHKTMSKRNMAHNFSNGVGNNVSLKPRATLLPGQTVSNINPNGLGMSTNPMTSPDMNLLKLSSPDLEHLIIQSNQGLVTTSPAPNASANPFMYRNQATNEQEGFADGFVKALADLHKQNQLVGAPMSPTSSLQGSYQRNLMSSGEMPIYTNLSSYNPNPLSSAYASGQIAYASAAHTSAAHASAAHTSAAHASAAHASAAHASSAHASAAHASAAHTSAVHASAAHASAHGGHHPPGRVLDAPQTVPEVPHPPGLDPASSPPSLSPIDLETQERIKMERKKLRNRIAASKCRKRKLERISRLEEKVKVLKTQNSDLATTAGVLREQVAQLKHKVMNHVTNGCQIAVISTAVAKSGEGTSC